MIFVKTLNVCNKVQQPAPIQIPIPETNLNQLNKPKTKQPSLQQALPILINKVKQCENNMKPQVN